MTVNMYLLRSRSVLLLCAFCICLLKPISSQEFVVSPTTVILFPEETSAVFECAVNPAVLTVAWEVDGTRYGLDQLQQGVLSGHNVTGSNITVSAPINGTKYVCVIPLTPPNPTVISDPAFLYIAAAPDMISNIIIDLDTVDADDDDDDDVSFTLSWNEPFANFNPIVNYTVTINCTNATFCPVVVNTSNVTTANVSFITDLSMMTTLSVTATNTIGTSDPAIRIITVPSDVGMVSVTCNAVDLTNQCTVTWNAPTNDSNNTVAAPIYYNVRYSGENITDGYQRVDMMTMTTITFTENNSEIDRDSDVNVNVTAINVFGSGPTSNNTVADIYGRSVIDITSMISNPNDVMDDFSVVVTCVINPTSTAEYCEVIARNDDAGLSPVSNSATIPDDMNSVTVTVSGLVCERMYEIVAGGTDGSVLVGPQIQQEEMVTAGLCPTPPPDMSTSMSIDDVSTMPSTMSSSLIVGTPQPQSGDDGNTGAIVGGVVGGLCGAIILLIVIIILICFCYRKSKKGNAKFNRATSPEKGATGVKVHTLDRYGKPIPLEGENTDTGTELTGFPAKSPEFTVNQVPATTFQGNDYQTEEKNRTPSAFVPEGSYDTLAPADEPTAPSAEVVPPAQNGQSNPNAPKLNYADLEQFTRKPASVKKPEPQPASQYAVIDPKSLQQGTYT